MLVACWEFYQSSFKGPQETLQMLQNLQQALEGLGVAISDAPLLRRMLDILPKPHYHQLFVNG